MAEDTDPESKTEDASPKRREDARRQGQIPFSTELVGAAVLLAGVLGLASYGKPLGEAMLGVFRHDIPRAFRGDFTPLDAQMLIARLAFVALTALAPLMGILLAAGIASSVAQAGFQITPERLEWKLDRLDPTQGFGRLFSMASLVKGGLGILKVLAVAGVAYFVIDGRIGVIVGLSRDRVGGAVFSAWSLVTRLTIYLAAAAVVISFIDYFYQRRRFENQLRMTKQEVKEELKESDGNPEVKGRMRQMARERAKRKMLKEVPKATVVITNPTHYAVALRYDGTKDAAPVLVAKGAGAFAKRIMQLARENGVPVLERPPLARALYKSVKEGQPIPALLFRAVAELIALVYRLRGVGVRP